MSYRRVIPRDLFNEADLLKCLGRLYILLENRGFPAGFVQEDVSEFAIRQDPSDGSIRVTNLQFAIKGREYYLRRPLNTRGFYPIYATPADDDGEEVRVFESEPEPTDGQAYLSQEFLALIGVDEA